jgi:hypothetical protein
MAYTRQYFWYCNKKNLVVLYQKRHDFIFIKSIVSIVSLLKTID